MLLSSCVCAECGGSVQTRRCVYRFRVLDECDEMLNMGFADDVETILKSATDSSAVQTLLFSATMPTWVKDVQKQYLNAGSVYVDLVGTDKMKASRCAICIR